MVTRQEEPGTELAVVLGASEDAVLREASSSLQRAHLKHYEAAGQDGSARYLEKLFELVVECVARRTLGPISSYSEHLAADRFNSGFTIAEVQTAFNVLEESVWRVVVPSLPTDCIAEATGLIGTVLGAGKDSLARTWVSLATNKHVGSLDLSALFDGVAS